MSYRDLFDYGYTRDEIYGDPDDYYEDNIIGGLCARCVNAMGEYWSDKCSHYDMPLWMVKRKNKCKHFKEYDYSKEDWLGDYY